MTAPFASALAEAARARLDRASELAQYRDDPLGFGCAVLGVARDTLVWGERPEYEARHWDGTAEPIVAILAALAGGQDVGVEAGTGTQKSFTAALVILWFLACWRGARVFTFAPKEDQLRLFIWAEMQKLWPQFQRRFPAAEFTDLRIRMDGDDTWGAWGYAVGVRAGEQVATKASGMHAPHLLIVNEETPGIPLAVIEAQRNTVTGTHNLRLSVGNPDSQQDALHQFCREPGVAHVRLSALDHPNVVTGCELVPGAVTLKSVARRAELYGEGSRLYQSRIRGVSPTEAADALIQAAWIDAAVARIGDLSLRRGEPAMGVDVANSEAGDLGAKSNWVGAVCLSVTAEPCPDANLLGAEVVAEARASKIRMKRVGVDSVGVGAGTVNEAKRLGFYVAALNGGERAWPTLDEPRDVAPGQKTVPNEERFKNLRAQMWWQLRMDLQHGLITLPNDPELKDDLLAPTWWTESGKIVVEPKEELSKRLPGSRSPNKGDAVVYGNWVRDRSVEKPPEVEVSAFDPEMLKADVERQYKPLVRRAAERAKLRKFGKGTIGPF